MRETLYVVDISNFIHRAAHAMNDLSTDQGFPTGAIYGTFTMLSTFMTKHRPKYMLVCYDWQGADNVRKLIYEDYKSNRTKKDFISAQELIVRRMIQLLGIPSVEERGWEADDLIASAVRSFKSDFDIEILTGDKDMLQLIEDGVRVYDSMKRQYYDTKTVEKKFGVRPDQIVDYLAIVGDKVDCIPGVAGIGHVGAGSLLSKYDSIEDIYENIDDITGANHSKLIKSKENAVVSKKLASLNDRLLEGLELSEIKVVHNEELLDLFKKLQFDNGIIRLMNLWSTYEKQQD